MSKRPKRRDRKRRATVPLYVKLPVYPDRPDVFRLGALDVPRGSRPVFQLANGDVGYGMAPERNGDCFRAAIATVLQVDVAQVPNGRLDERLAAGEDPQEINRSYMVRLDEWLAARGLAVVHPKVPVDRDRWIGVCRVETRPRDLMLARRYGVELCEHFTDHCLIMCHDRAIFDPAVSMKVPDGMRLRPFTPEDVTYGISFDPKE